MKLDVTYLGLHNCRNDLVQLLETSPGLAFILKDRIDAFFGLNAITLQYLDQKLSDLQRKYMELDDKGEPVTEVCANGQMQYVFLKHPIENGVPVIGVDCKMQYLAECKHFFETPVTITV